MVTLALEYDISAIEDAGMIDAGWKEELPDDSAPYTSTIVFLVRKGNPKNIQDWDDLVRDDVDVDHTKPKDIRRGQMELPGSLGLCGKEI